MQPPTPRERCTDESGRVLWDETYIFKRGHGPGEELVRNGVAYVVVACTWSASQRLLSTVVRPIEKLSTS